MRSHATPRAKRPNWLELGSAAVDAGDLVAAEQCFKEAIKADKGNARSHFYLAIILEAREKYGPAAEHLTRALHLDPADAAAARRLASLVSRQPLALNVELDAAGIKAALNHDSASSWIIANLALQYLKAYSPLGAACDLGKRQDWRHAAQSLCVARTADALKNELFLEVLRTNILRDADVEHLLTAVRRVLLLEVPEERFRDRDLVTFAIAMMHQCRSNEYIWSVTDAEHVRLAGLQLSLPALLAGNVHEGCRLLQALLYRDIWAALGECAAEQISKFRPKAVREAVQHLALEEADLHARAQRIPKLDVIIDEVSRKVALQYERSPYPRWTSLRTPSEGEERKLLGNFFTPTELSFMDQAYNLLIAGCGTGHQAVHGALSSPNAHVTAVDLSATALAYAAMMAERYAMRNIEFLQADILDLASFARCNKQFHIIECMGVLHHMADPFEGWRKLLDCLAPGGKILIGLYSATARRVITELRSDPAFPGSGCDDEALRKFRQVLINRTQVELGGELKLRTDFYSASEFRDLTCHVSERCVTLAEISRFLRANALTFRGFWMDIGELDEFHRTFPNELWPGRLEVWEEFEAARPHTFGAMYNFWCDAA
jgi:2-polyprenyl-3-methyl-5-hydroxy-6-metoxy-1,4-benzoquinol methylase/tetratricopeptide (TPR) repeat protein